MNPYVYLTASALRLFRWPQSAAEFDALYTCPHAVTQPDPSSNLVKVNLNSQAYKLSKITELTVSQDSCLVSCARSFDSIVPFKDLDELRAEINRRERALSISVFEDRCYRLSIRGLGVFSKMLEDTFGSLKNQILVQSQKSVTGSGLLLLDWPTQFSGASLIASRRLTYVGHQEMVIEYNKCTTKLKLLDLKDRDSCLYHVPTCCVYEAQT